MTRDDRPDRDSRAAEYVLGTLRGADRARFEAEAAADPALRRVVARWEERLVGMVETVEPVAPPAALWERIERAVEPVPVRPVERVAERPGLLGGLWNSLALWRSAAAMATAAACLLAVVALRPPPPPEPALVAVLQAPAGPAFAVRIPSVDRGADRVAVTPVGDQPPPGGRDYELWVVPPQQAPHSLGVIAPAGVTRVPLERVPAELLRRGATLAVSLEPAGGSPTGLPTGPVLYTGMLVEAR